MNQSEQTSGLIYALSAYIIWGLLPIFWKQLVDVDAYEVVAHRIVWCFFIVFAWVGLRGGLGTIAAHLRDVKLVARLFVAAILIGLNWGVFIWAVNNGFVIDTALGYFINPLLTVLLGMLFFKEQLRVGQKIALVIASLAVAVLVIANGELPVISLVLALSFSLYSMVKKTTSVSAANGLVIETFVLVPFSLAYLAYLHTVDQSVFGQVLMTDVYLVLGGLMTLVPLLLFAAAARRVRMNVLGMSQYIAPTISFLLGVFLYKEDFGWERQVAFGLIWLALIFYSVDQLRNYRRERRARA